MAINETTPNKTAAQAINETTPNKTAAQAINETTPNKTAAQAIKLCRLACMFNMWKGNTNTCSMVMNIPYKYPGMSSSRSVVPAPSGV